MLAHVVLADANVLYSRVLRDYLLYAVTRRLITINWSRMILDDMAEHISANIAGFTRRRAAYLVVKMTEAFPDACGRAWPGRVTLNSTATRFLTRTTGRSWPPRWLPFLASAPRCEPDERDVGRGDRSYHIIIVSCLVWVWHRSVGRRAGEDPGAWHKTMLQSRTCSMARSNLRKSVEA